MSLICLDPMSIMKTPHLQNSVRPFSLADQRIRGNLVRLSSEINGILARHAYPDSVSYLLGELAVLACSMASFLKFDGILTLQVKSDGPLHTLMADITSAGDLRCYAAFDEDGEEDLQGNDFFSLLGSGYMAITVDQKLKDRYQGIVSLSGKSLTETVQHYINQSEQADLFIKAACGKVDGEFSAASLVIQRLPLDSHAGNLEELHDQWLAAQLFQQSVEFQELINSKLDSDALLFRLFHELGVRVYEPQCLQDNCRCDRSRLAHVLSSLSDEEIQDSFMNDHITSVCEFCSTVYIFDRAEIYNLRRSGPSLN